MNTQEMLTEIKNEIVAIIDSGKVVQPSTQLVKFHNVLHTTEASNLALFSLYESLRKSHDKAWYNLVNHWTKLT